MKYSFIAVSVALAALLSGPVSAFADEPLIAGAVDTSAEATSSTGAAVTFSVTASDTDSNPLTPGCSPASGSVFSIGTTTVTCTATSILNSASTTSATFDVGVFD